MNFGYIKSKLTDKESKFTTESKVPSNFKNNISTSEGTELKNVFTYLKGRT